MIVKNALRAVLVIVTLSLASPLMAAKGFKYTYVDFGYQHTEGDPVNADFAMVDASFSTFEYMALRAGVSRGRLDEYSAAKSDPDMTEFRFGAIGHYPIVKKKLDMYFGATYFYNSINATEISSIADSGVLLDAGVRFQAVKKKLELDAGVRRRTGDEEDDFGVVGILLKISKKLSINVNAQANEDVQKYFAGLRLDM